MKFYKKTLLSILNNEDGSPVVVVLLLMVLLTVIGIAVINTSSIDQEMSGQHRRHKVAFYGADGGTQVACEVLEQNIACITGFSTAVIGSVTVNDLNFWLNTSAVEPTSAATSDFYYPTISSPHTLLTAGGNTVFAEGSAIQQNAGYESKGRGSAGGGGLIMYDVFSRRIETSEESTIHVRWRHAIGQQGSCNY
ncbi:PilX [uncultured Desulfobacterium sp.]|uniref:PilX n=1 Tax=uncultured Desulfobacterium sp. TaxID=201089 RepID=A0A445N3J2_9BACT|nr:PilX [uncultured Desulfobacterium sp.]